MSKIYLEVLFRAFLSTAAFILCSLHCLAQFDVQKSHHNDGSSRIHVSEQGGGEVVNDNTFNNIIKINPFILANGEIPIYYERFLIPQISVELAIGPTFKDNLEALNNEILMSSINNGYNQTLMNNNSTDKGGFTAKIALRYFPTGIDDYPEGFYLSPQLNYAVHNSAFRAPSDGLPPARTDLKSHYTDALLLLGYQLLASKHLVFDIYFGAGIRQLHIEYISRTDDFVFTGLTYYNNQIIQNTVPRISIGLKTGILF